MTNSHLAHRLLLAGTYILAVASASTNCENWSGHWYVLRGHGGPGVFPVTQSGCNVTINNGAEYTYYIATGNTLQCRPDDVVQQSLCTHFYRNVSSGASNPATMILRGQSQLPDSKEPPQPSAESPANDTVWRRQYTPGPCSRPSRSCYRHWGGSWVKFGRNFTVTQDGCSVTAKQWYISSHSYESSTHYTACGSSLMPDNPEVDVYMIISEDGKNATCPAPCAVVWTRRPEDPPKPPLPSCLALGDCPIQFSDGLKPPCCDGLPVNDVVGGKCDGQVGAHGYPTAGQICVKCLGEYEMCDDNPHSCCVGYTCESQGISGSRCFPSTAASAAKALV